MCVCMYVGARRNSSHSSQPILMIYGSKERYGPDSATVLCRKSENCRMDGGAAILVIKAVSLPQFSTDFNDLWLKTKIRT